MSDSSSSFSSPFLLLETETASSRQEHLHDKRLSYLLAILYGELRAIERVR
ncbi:MAG: hypothetical protein ACFFD4_09015 [Candidatus Odinarchaeota archaeon]